MTPKMFMEDPGGVPEAFTVEKLCVTRKNCRAWARSLRCCQSASRPDNKLKIWAMHAGRSAQRSQGAYE